MKLKNILPKLGVLFVIIVAFASCEEEFSNIDTNIIGETSPFPEIIFPVRAYSQKLTSVQTNNSPMTQSNRSFGLGVYNDPLYGKSNINLLSQLGLSSSSTEPQFGDCAVLDSVVLYLPFFSTSIIENGEITYTVDSIYGNSPIDINVYESNLLLRDFDPSSGFEDPQNYYSTVGDQLNNGNLGELVGTIEDFVPTSDALVLNDSTSLAPGLRMKLSTTFFENKILANEGAQVFINNNFFKEFFRGLYFEVSSPTEDGSLVLFDVGETDDEEIGVILYVSSKELTSPDTCATTTAESTQASYRYFLNQISVNAYENAPLPATVEDAVTLPNRIQGEEILYLRGGEGIVSIIELFDDEDLIGFDGENLTSTPNDVPDALDQLRSQAWIINEANLILYVDQNQVTGGDTEPERLIIFDTKNQGVLADYAADLTGSAAPVDAVVDHLGRLERGSDGNGSFYKIKITNHLSNLINRDSLDVPLGLIVSQNVTNTAFLDLETPIQLRDATNPENDIFLESVPATSILSPEGTALHGNLSSDAGKRLKLQIFYTEPE